MLATTLLFGILSAFRGTRLPPRDGSAVGVGTHHDGSGLTSHTTDVFFAAEVALAVVLMLVGAFAGLAVVLCPVRIFGVVSFASARPMRELGVRRAFGAHTSDEPSSSPSL